MRIESCAKLKKQYIHAVGLETIFLEEIFDKFDLHLFEAGEYLCHAGAHVEFFHIIIEGKCKVLPSSEEGKEVLLTYLKPVAICGDIELFNECEALHSVKAVEKVVAVAIPRRVFFDAMMKQPPFLQMLCRNFANKIYETSSNSSSNLLYSTKSRLSRCLLEEAQEQGSNTIQVKTSELAQHLGITARHVRRVMTSYEEDKVIKRHEGKVILLDIETLQYDSSYI